MQIDPQSGFAPRPAPAPMTPGLRSSRVITYVQGAVGILNGLLLIFGGAAFATALDLRSAGGAALVIAVGVIVAVVSALVIWGGVLLGSQSRRARVGVLAYQYLSIVVGILSLANPLQAALRVVLAGVVIYYLQFERQTVALFAKQTPDDPSAEGSSSPRS